MQKNNVLIMGDSYSTFAGYIPEGYGPYYPENDKWKTDVLDVSQTWWHQVVSAMGANLVRNDSWSGAPICYTGYDNADVSKSSSFIYRLRKLKEDGFFAQNQIHTVFVFGGTNDSWCNAPLGEMQFADWKREDLFCVQPAICYFMAQLKQNHPNTRILFMVNCGIKQEIIRCVQDAAQHYEIECVALHDLDKIDGHPTVLGMGQIYDQLMQYLLRKE